MKDSLLLNIITPDRKLYSGDIKEITTENVYGGIQILANHIDTVTLLNPAVTKFTSVDGKVKQVFTSGGIMYIQQNTVNMLCQAAEWPEEIDAARAEASKKRAEERLSKKDEIDEVRAENALKRALIRLRVKGM